MHARHCWHTTEVNLHACHVVIISSISSCSTAYQALHSNVIQLVDNLHLFVRMCKRTIVPK